MSDQTLEERAALHAEWHNHPDIQALKQAALTHAQEHQLTFTPEGMTKVNQFVNTWIADNGPLPDSGILCN